VSSSLLQLCSVRSVQTLLFFDCRLRRRGRHRPCSARRRPPVGIVEVALISARSADSAARGAILSSNHPMMLVAEVLLDRLNSLRAGGHYPPPHGEVIAKVDTSPCLDASRASLRARHLSGALYPSSSPRLCSEALNANLRAQSRQGRN
jgi:hypothetical protein